ncbi:hypothetical protein CK203_104799 [Vitis vinifera]|uniref:DUF4283 domain-containing protein n=1 Tax=Vitis vinifera TaxID=29760 RepID=A0A438FHU1_VITVI|nr:hypothetical protein CK203_104799 [Vitis vinifera]
MVTVGEKDISSERKLMDRCLVGRWGQIPLSDPDMYALESWGRTRWNIKGGLKLARIGGPLLLIEFKNKDEADKVLLRGNRWFKESTLHLDRWDPKVGCSQNGERAESVWVRVVGLPLHFWSQEAFRKIGDCCGGLVAVDVNTANFKELRWARISVRYEGVEWPSTMQVVVGSLCYALQLWWEVKPGLLEVVPAIRNEKGKEREARDDGEGDTRWIQKVTEADGTIGDRSSTWGKSSCSGPGGNLPLGRQGESGGKESPLWRAKGLKAQRKWAGPIRSLLKAWWGGTTHSEDRKRVRAPDGCHSGGGEQEGDLFGSKLGLPRPAVNLSEITDEALLEEASRYSTQTSYPFLSLGKRDISLFSTPSGGRGREAEVSDLVGRESGNTEEFSVGALERVSQEDEEEEAKRGMCWQSSSLAKFSRYLGMPTRDLKGKYCGGGGEGGEARAGLNEATNASWNETKIQEMSTGIVRSLGVGRFLEWGAVDSRGAAGGIVSCEDGFIWTFTGVYGPTLRRKRESFWEELGAIKGLWNGPWCVAGDFNAILRPEERSRGGSLNSIMRRLDRFLVNEEWDSHFGDARQFLLPRPVSDHFPILMDGGGLRRGPIPFRFENMWLKAEGVKDLLKLGGRKAASVDPQMEYWDAKEKTSRLSLEELEARNEAKEE